MMASLARGIYRRARKAVAPHVLEQLADDAKTTYICTAFLIENTFLSSVTSGHRWLTCFALLAVLLRVLVPSGYMPAALNDGWHLKLCSHGMTDATAMVLLGQGEHHQHHHHQGAQEKGDQNQGQSSNSLDQCELGAGFLAAVILDVFILVLALFLAANVLAAFRQFALSQVHPRFYNTRAPPQLRTV